MSRRKTKGSNGGDKHGYEVGYRRPPKDTQFRLGHSGNPRGRRKGLRNLVTEFRCHTQQMWNLAPILGNTAMAVVVHPCQQEAGRGVSLCRRRLEGRGTNLRSALIQLFCAMTFNS